MTQKSTAFSEEITAWLKSDHPKTILGLNKVFGERTFAIIFMILMAPAALPIPTGGITDVFAIITIIIAAQMVLGRDRLWLPKRWRGMKISKSLSNTILPKLAKIIKRLERHSKPRYTFLFKSRVSKAILGVIVILFSIGTILAPPFSGLDTLPAMGVVVLSIAIVLEDGIAAIFGMVIGSLGLFLQLFFSAAIIELIKRIF
jgi:hypothetical protein